MPSHILGRENTVAGRKFQDRGPLPKSPPDISAMIHVEPKDDKMRKLIRHPVAGGFREEGGADWPEDAFTMRRLRDGDVVRAEPPSKEAPVRRPRPPRSQSTESKPAEENS